MKKFSKLNDIDNQEIAFFYKSKLFLVETNHGYRIYNEFLIDDLATDFLKKYTKSSFTIYNIHGIENIKEKASDFNIIINNNNSDYVELSIKNEIVASIDTIMRDSTDNYKNHITNIFDKEMLVNPDFMSVLLTTLSILINN